MASKKATTRKSRLNRKGRAKPPAAAAAPLEPEVDDIPMTLHLFPPIAVPLTREAARQWLLDECSTLFEACLFGFLNAMDKETRQAFTMLQCEGLGLMQSAIEVALTGSSRTIELARSLPDWNLATRQLAQAVRSGLCDRLGASCDETPRGFGALAEILEARIGVERLGDPERTKAAQALAYPMASAEQAEAG